MDGEPARESGEELKKTKAGDPTNGHRSVDGSRFVVGGFRLKRRRGRTAGSSGHGGKSSAAEKRKGGGKGLSDDEKRPRGRGGGLSEVSRAGRDNRPLSLEGKAPQFPNERHFSFLKQTGDEDAGGGGGGKEEEGGGSHGGGGDVEEVTPDDIQCDITLNDVGKPLV